MRSRVLFDTLDLANFPKRNWGILRAGSNTRPVIWIVEENGIRAIVKDFSRNKAFFRHVIGRFLVWREKRAYHRLNGIRGVPTLYRVIKGQALVLEEIQGDSLENLEKRRKLPQSFFRDLEVLVRGFHQRGMAHCDLKRAPNTICGMDGHPYIVDWGASISKAEMRIPPLNLIYRRFVRDDEMAIIKLKLRHIPQRVTREEKARYAYRGAGERLIRALRDKGRELLQKAV
jgi:RIO-like serine/threonine protein kinase